MPYPGEVKMGGPSTLVIESPRQTEAGQALTELRATIERYDVLVGKLGSRLNAVLRPGTPGVCDGMPQPCYQTAMANEINAMRCLVRDVTDGLESIYERLEV